MYALAYECIEPTPDIMFKISRFPSSPSGKSTRRLERGGGAAKLGIDSASSPAYMPFGYAYTLTAPPSFAVHMRRLYAISTSNKRLAFFRCSLGTPPGEPCCVTSRAPGTLHKLVGSLCSPRPRTGSDPLAATISFPLQPITVRVVDDDDCHGKGELRARLAPGRNYPCWRARVVGDDHLPFRTHTASPCICEAGQSSQSGRRRSNMETLPSTRRPPWYRDGLYIAWRAWCAK